MTSTQLISALAIIHTVAVAIVNLTETPPDSSFFGKVYNLIEVVAGILTTKAKTEPDDKSTK